LLLPDNPKEVILVSQTPGFPESCGS